MIRSLISGTLAIAGATVAVPAGTALAQSEPAVERAAITVIVPRPRQTGKTYTGTPIETLNAQSVVYIDDLDLSTPAGKSELEDRVRQAAKTSCDWLDELYPLAETTNAQCVSQAMDAAKPQMDKALAMNR